MHFLKTKIDIPVSREEVFSFFSNAVNLERITPIELGFKIISPSQILMTSGALIDYRLRLFGIPFIWTTKILSWNPPYEFVDEQIRGPYKKWIHKHSFLQTNDGTTIIDEVQYRLPLWPLGEVAYPVVRIELNRIFSFRREAIKRVFRANKLYYDK